jgi:dihydrofolate reductase
MRKLILQMHISIDGFVAGLKGELDWVNQSRDDELVNCINELHDPVDCIIMGREMSDGFVEGWASYLASPDMSDAPARRLARKMVETPKIVFSNTLEKVESENTTLAKGDALQEVSQLKNRSGGDIIVFGGASFVSSLIKQGLIDQYNFLVNPVALGEGMTIFSNLDDKLNLQLVKAKGFDCGVVFLCYEPKH